MSTTKHTPGPWKAVIRQNTACQFTVGRGEHSATVLVPVAETSGTAPTAEKTANARLIAAAPDLLGALRRIVEEADKAGFGELHPEARKLLANIDAGH